MCACAICTCEDRLCNRRSTRPLFLPVAQFFFSLSMEACFSLPNTSWLEMVSAQRAEQGLGATAGLGAAPNRLVHSPPPPPPPAAPPLFSHTTSTVHVMTELHLLQVASTIYGTGISRGSISTCSVTLKMSVCAKHRIALDTCCTWLRNHYSLYSGSTRI